MAPLRRAPDAEELARGEGPVMKFIGRLFLVALMIIALARAALV
jgi:hypothetical protein